MPRLQGSMPKNLAQLGEGVVSRYLTSTGSHGWLSRTIRKSISCFSLLRSRKSSNSPSPVSVQKWQALSRWQATRFSNRAAGSVTAE
jgi:hypothetical protein